MSRNDNLFELLQSSTVNEILIENSQFIIRFFRIASYIWFNRSWNFVQSDNSVTDLRLSIWMSVWKNWFLIAQKNKLSDINVCKSCSCKMIVVRINVFNRIWVQDCLCLCCYNIRIVIMNCYQRLLSLYFENNLSVLERHLMLHDLL